MLVEENLRTCAQYLTVSHREYSEEHRANTYHILVLRGKLQTAVRCITELETGGMLQPADMFTKTGERVMEVLCTTHPDALPPTAASLDTYPDLPPELVPLEITNYTVTEVVGQLSGVSGPWGKYSVSL